MTYIMLLANTAVPFTFGSIIGNILGLTAIILIEGVLIKFWLRVRYAKSFSVSAIANIVSFVIGATILSVEWIGVMYGTVSERLVFLTLIACFLGTLGVEFVIARNAFSSMPSRKIGAVILTANLVTYFVVIFLVGYLMTGGQGKGGKPRTAAEVREFAKALEHYQIDLDVFLRMSAQEKMDAMSSSVLHEKEYGSKENTALYYAPKETQYTLTSDGKDHLSEGGRDEFDSDIVYINGTLQNKTN